MLADSTKSALFLSSLILNGVLIAGVFWFAGSSRQRALDGDIRQAEEKIWIMEEVATQLRSDAPDRVERAVDILDRNIDVENKIIYKMSTR